MKLTRVTCDVSYLYEPEVRCGWCHKKIGDCFTRVQNRSYCNDLCLDFGEKRHKLQCDVAARQRWNGA